VHDVYVKMRKQFYQNKNECLPFRLHPATAPLGLNQLQAILPSSPFYNPLIAL